MTEAPAGVVRAVIARLWLGGDAAGEDASRTPAAPTRDVSPRPDDTEARLGDVRLRPHQRVAVARLRRAFDEFGGALLADDVGLGKTYVALAIAAPSSSTARACVVAPAALRDMWRDAMGTARVWTDFVSVEALSRGREPTERYALVVFDEAHHLRNPATRRYGAAARMAYGARVLLLSATPVHNRRDDLTAMLALFLGGAAGSLDEDALARCVVRRVRAAVGHGDSGPAVAPLEWLRVTGSDDALDAIAELPAPVAPADGGDGGALLAHALVRQWSSSDGALRAALKRRLARAAALEEALAEGRHPSRAELRAWAYADDAVQLAFPGLVTAARDVAAELLPAVREHASAVRQLLGRLGAERDRARADQLRALRARHPGEHIVAFSSFADTVAALFRELRGDGGVAALTANGALVAGGALSRREAIARFAPRASGARTPARAERVNLLLATDLLSEGVNLQDASVVVHLDLPWTPARLEQRVGRLARIGSLHCRIAVYALSPPASAERLLAVERRLREKASVAARAVGMAGVILPPLAGAGPLPPSAPELAEEVRATLAAWLTADAATAAGVPGEVALPPAQPDVPLIGAALAARPGFVAALLDGASPMLVAWHDAEQSGSAGVATSDLRAVAAVIATAGGASVPVDGRACTRALLLIDRWRQARQANADAGVHDTASAGARRRVIQRIARIVRRAAYHRRPAVVALAGAARRAALLPCGAGAEHILDELAGAEMPDDAWLRAVGAFGEAQARSQARAPKPDAPARTADPRLCAVLLLQPQGGSD